MIDSALDRLKTINTPQTLLSLILLGLLSACATQPQQAPSIPVMQEQENYAAHARSYYEPPGPPNDPWGPYIKEASARFDVPELWIRAVINRESGGRLYDSSGNFITSMPGAMGLMQLMPPAYDDLRQQYDLGSDPYAPRDNIMAGTAYIRQMYDIYGSPGFLAAYNDGPGNLDRYLRQNRPLPKETRNYVAAIGRQIAGTWPQHRSQADLLVARHDPAQSDSYLPDTYSNTANNSVYNNTDNTADQLNAVSMEHPENQSVSAAWAARGFPQQAPTSSYTPSHITPPPPPQHTLTLQNSQNHNNIVRIHNIPLAHPHTVSKIATDIPTSSHHSSTNQSSSANWSIQVGSYNTMKQAQTVATRIRSFSASTLKQAHLEITTVKLGKRTLYRTRFTKLTPSQAQSSCKHIQQISACIPISSTTHF